MYPYIIGNKYFEITKVNQNNVVLNLLSRWTTDDEITIKLSPGRSVVRVVKNFNQNWQISMTYVEDFAANMQNKINGIWDNFKHKEFFFRKSINISELEISNQA